jgi:hypothetical protein
MLTWIGDAFIVAGLWGVGSKYRPAFLASLVGESLWLTAACFRRDWALGSICAVFFLMALRGYVLWGRQAEDERLLAQTAKLKEMNDFQAGFRAGLREGKRGETN